MTILQRIRDLLREIRDECEERLYQREEKRAAIEARLDEITEPYEKDLGDG
jgi:hypothetical protein